MLNTKRLSSPLVKEYEAFKSKTDWPFFNLKYFYMAQKMSIELSLLMWNILYNHWIAHMIICICHNDSSSQKRHAMFVDDQGNFIMLSNS